MIIPEGWKIGHDTSVSDQWLREFPSFVDQATNADHLRALHFVLDTRKRWCFPHTVNRLSGLLQVKARQLGVDVPMVRHPDEEKPWHGRFRQVETAPPKMQPDPVDITARIVGEGDR